MISRALFWKEMRDSRWLLGIGLAVAVLTGASLPFLFDYLAGLVGSAPLPEWIRNTVDQQMANYNLYIWSNWYGKNMPQYALVLAVILGATALAGERGRGSLEFTLTRPLSRRAVYLTKAAVGVAVLTVIAVVATVVTLAVGPVAGRAVDPVWFLSGLPALVAGSFALHALTLVFSARTSDAIKAGVAGVVVALALTIPTYIPALSKWSLFYHMASGQALAQSGVGVLVAAGPSVAILTGAAAALHYTAFRFFDRIEL